MRRQHWLLNLGCGCALALGLWLAPAAALASELSWLGPADCDQREQLEFQVQRALSAPLSEVAELQFQVHVERTRPGARARLLVQSSTEARVSERVLEAPDCAGLVDTLAVAMALALEAAASSAQPPAQPDSAAAPASEPPAPREEPPAPEPDSLVTDELTAGLWRASLWLSGDAGSLPEAGLGIALGVELAWPRLELRALATLWLEQETRLSRAAPLGGDLSLVTGALLACTSLAGSPRDVLALSLCAGGELGRLSGTGTGVLRPRDAYSLWLAGRADAELYWNVPSTRLRLGAQLGLAVPFIRDDFVLDGIGAVHRPKSLAGRTGVGIGITFE